MKHWCIQIDVDNYTIIAAFNKFGFDYYRDKGWFQETKGQSQTITRALLLIEHIKARTDLPKINKFRIFQVSHYNDFSEMLGQ